MSDANLLVCAQCSLSICVLCLAYCSVQEQSKMVHLCSESTNYTPEPSQQRKRNSIESILATAIYYSSRTNGTPRSCVHPCWFACPPTCRHTLSVERTATAAGRYGIYENAMTPPTDAEKLIREVECLRDCCSHDSTH